MIQFTCSKITLDAVCKWIRAIVLEVRFPFLFSSITWKLVRNSDSQLPQTFSVRKAGGRAQLSVLTSPPGDSDTHSYLRTTGLEEDEYRCKKAVSSLQCKTRFCSSWCCSYALEMKKVFLFSKCFLYVEIHFKGYGRKGSQWQRVSLSVNKNLSFK